MDWEEFKEEYGLSEEDRVHFYDGPLLREMKRRSEIKRKKYIKALKITVAITIIWIIFGIVFLIR